MKRLLLLVLLSSAVLLCCTAPAVGPVACTEDDIAPAAHLAMQHINKYHHHGYKFQLNQTLDHKLEKTDDGCNIELHLDLLETKCHVVNPTPFEDCPLREEHDQEVMADCKVDMTVKSGEAKVTEYLCDTKQVKSNQEMVSMCPDCPILIPLNSTEGLKSVREAVNKFNENTTHQHYYILKEVGRITSGYMMMAGMAYYAEFALVETFCPMGTRIVIEACQPKCPDRARHAFCTSSYTRTNGLGSVECEYYPPLLVKRRHRVGIIIMVTIIMVTIIMIVMIVMDNNTIPMVKIILKDPLLILIIMVMVIEKNIIPMVKIILKDPLPMLMIMVMDPLPMLMAKDHLPMLMIMVMDPLPMLMAKDHLLMLMIMVMDPLPMLMAKDPHLAMEDGPTTNSSVRAMDFWPMLIQLSTRSAPGLILNPDTNQNCICPEIHTVPTQRKHYCLLCSEDFANTIYV
ncbi:hypothetical protein Q8A73_009462 [Channa argus]|nr:hypothetical protein Q8A73_009462 [Channa argus]